jgi:hypothetical protein
MLEQWAIPGAMSFSFNSTDPARKICLKVICGREAEGVLADLDERFASQGQPLSSPTLAARCPERVEAEAKLWFVLIPSAIDAAFLTSHPSPTKELS